MVGNNLSVSLDAMLPGNEEQLKREVARAMKLDAGSIADVRILRKSVDARKRGNVHFVLNVEVELEGAKGAKDAGESSRIAASGSREIEPAIRDIPNICPSLRPVVVGTGPAGLFCALRLARAGLRPLVVERGKAVEERRQDVQAFAAGGALDTQSNIQFGEGGAGTFSDGKLTTGTKSPWSRSVLEEFVACGAPEDILVDAKPHIGTDFLPEVVRNLRQRIVDAGGEVRFSTQLVGFAPAEEPRNQEPHGQNDRDQNDCNQNDRNQEDRSEGFSLRPEDEHQEPHGQEDRSEGFSLRSSQNGIWAVTLKDLRTGTEETVETDALVLAIGHSARDTFATLNDAGVAMKRKPFAVGVRIEHPQALINKAQYGKAAGHPALPPAAYQLAYHTRAGRGVYTFCMCPGGDVVAAASEEGGVCTNGMSNHARDGEFANAALLVEVHPEDLPEEAGVLAGVDLQRQLERAAFQAGGGTYAAPAQTVGGFLGTAGKGEGKGEGETVQGTYSRGLVAADLHEVLPSFVTEALTEALPQLGRKLKGFDNPNAVMTAVEARSSSPVCILRDKRALQSVSHPGVYPAGEGAGYAGGIMSAACDGIRVAQAVIRDACMRQAVSALKKGKPVVFPTDTVAGVGVSVRHCEDAHGLARIKGRDEDKPVAWLVGSVEDLDVYGEGVPDYARELAREGWPGALTLVVRASENVPAAYQSAQGTIGLRMPDSETAVRLIEGAGSPLATTSANLAGESAPYSLSELSGAFREQAVLGGAVFLEAEECGSGAASTVVDCTGPEPRTLRGGEPTASHA